MPIKREPKFDPVIVAAKRTAVGRAHKGALASVRPDEFAATVLKDLLAQVPGLKHEVIDDVILGCAFPEGEQGLNISRTVLLRAGIPDSVPGETINRFCSSGLQSIAHAAMAIISGMSEVVIAGGVESMSMVPMTGNKFAPNPDAAINDPKSNTSMGLTAENVAEKYGISREDQDSFALNSHKKAANALKKNLFMDEITPIEVKLTTVGDDNKVIEKFFTHSIDEGVRADSTLEALSKLRPVFKMGGTVTAGNASPTNDGAAAVMIMSLAKAQELGLKPLARFISFGVAGVAPEIMGIGPIQAIPKALKLADLTIEDIDLFELNEAFASQSLAVIRELKLDQDKVNVNGGAIALGHPLGCTGAKLTTQIVHEMGRRGVKYGMVTMCIGGGMGAAGIFENLQ